ncbi:MAG: hypothetical protein K0Q55_2085 [Verrucomicrobia bacterium]|jgi:hypothetical protein|nr:hypothetical protein [Verrucomicrobiota bacterium]
MKTILTALLGLFALGVSAQTDPAKIKPATTNSIEIATPPVTEGTVSLKAMQSLEQKPPVPLKPNEIKTEKGISSGVLPQAVKSDNPLQLINPAAPKEYGEAKDNTVFDDRTGQAQGIKLFSFSWFNKDKKKTQKTSSPKPEKKPKAESK